MRYAFKFYEQLDHFNIQENYLNSWLNFDSGLTQLFVILSSEILTSVSSAMLRNDKYQQ